MDAPLIVVLNHPAWWDPMVGVLLAKRLFPDRPHYAPIDAEALKKYRVLGKLGFFGVEQGTLSGARDFLASCQSIFERSHNAVIWVTAQGGFTDPRRRPVSIKSGVAHLATRVKAGGVLPLAIEYPFWNECYPEVLARFGELLPLSDRRGTEEWEVSIAGALESTMDALSEIALLRDPRRFETLLTGSVGEGGLYDAFRRISTWFRGEQFHPGHEDEHHKAT